MSFQILIVSTHRAYAETLRWQLAQVADQKSQIVVETEVSRLPAIDASNFHAVILDQFFGSVDGLELLRLMKKQGAKARMVVIGDPGEGLDAAQALAEGADLFFTRPHGGEEWKELVCALDRLLTFSRTDLYAVEAGSGRRERSPGTLRIFQPEPVPFLLSQTVLETHPARSTGEETEFSSVWKVPDRFESPQQIPDLFFQELSVPPEASQDEPEKKGTELPHLDTRWKVSLSGELIEGADLVAPDRCAFITYFFFRKLAEVAIALEVDYFNHMTLYGPFFQQVLVADNWAIQHAVFETRWTTEEQRDQFVKWCCEQSF